MTLRALIGRTLAIFLIVGLIAAPLASLAVAKPMDASAMAFSAMPDAMPCCPDEPTSNPCPDCPLIAMCIFKVAFEAPYATDAVPERVAHKTSHRMHDEQPASKLDRPPPDHPPRLSI